MSSKKSTAVKAVTTGLASLMAVSAMAANNSGTSTAKASTTAPKLRDKLSLSYIGSYAGPAINNLSAFVPLAEGGDDLESPQYIENTLKAGYKFNSSVNAGAAFNFLYTPVMGKGFDLLDPYLHLTNGKLIQAGNVTVGGDLRAYLPASESSQDSGLITQLRTNQSISLSIPGSRFSLGTYSYLRYYAYGNGSKEDAANIRAYIGPHVDYRISPKISASVLYEMAAAHDRNADITEFYSGGTDLQASVSFELSPNLTVMPYLNMYPSSLSLSSTSFNMLILGKLL